LRDPAEIVAGSHSPHDVDLRLLEYEVYGAWWDLLGELDITLIVTREYEHLLVAMRADPVKGPVLSVMRMPHPSGLAVDRLRGLVHVAATRNPNQIYDLAPLQGCLPRLDLPASFEGERPLMPVRTRFFPGCMYMHDLAVVGDGLYANAVGQNSVVKLWPNGNHEIVWWPRCVETPNGPLLGRNYLQLNSIAAGETIEDSFFSASTDTVSDLVPGDPDFPTDKRGVIFSGATREPIVGGLTRPHSARLYRDLIWVDNSGYGEVGFIEEGRFRVVSELPGWTRGLCFLNRIMFVGTSRVLPRFRQYAPGLDLATSVCGVHAVDIDSGEMVASITWPFGSQIFAIDWVETSFSTGLPFLPDRESDRERSALLFYAFRVADAKED
jgi:uncharacterized protein (TIGR03032 family)